MTRTLDDQTRDFQRVMVRLIKKYQFRDRNETVAYGLSVSQAYALRSLAERGPLSMSTLAEDLNLTVSATTRLIDSLVAKSLVKRRQSDADRRVWRASLAVRGRRLWNQIEGELLDVDARVLQTLAPREREAVIRAMSLLVDATEAWRRSRAAPAAGG
jgi:DNA-binding MarR family transcriptional regulator